GDLGRRSHALVRLGPPGRRRHDRHLGVEPSKPDRVVVDARERRRAEHGRGGHPAAARATRAGDAAVIEAGDVRRLPDVPGDERDPWLTPDGKTLYFTSDRDGSLSIYTASVQPR